MCPAAYELENLRKGIILRNRVTFSLLRKSTFLFENIMLLWWIQDFSWWGGGGGGGGRIN